MNDTKSEDFTSKTITNAVKISKLICNVCSIVKQIKNYFHFTINDMSICYASFNIRIQS